jgi:hypothetical protein
MLPIIFLLVWLVTRVSTCSFYFVSILREKSLIYRVEKPLLAIRCNKAKSSLSTLHRPKEVQTAAGAFCCYCERDENSKANKVFRI